MRRILACSLVLCLLAVPSTTALETDPYEAWGHDLRDATDALNAKINYELQKVLDRVNGRRGIRRLTCDTVANHVAAHFRMIIFHPIEIWASKSPLIERYPPTEDAELASRKTNVLGNTSSWDIATWLPYAPTIEVHGVRIGTDKMAHFFSGGSSYYSLYLRARRQGLSADEAQRTVIDRGIFSEKTYLGYGTSGVLSAADLEANYRGMTFFLGLCGGDSPQLQRTGEGRNCRRGLSHNSMISAGQVTKVGDDRLWRTVQKLCEPDMVGLKKVGPGIQWLREGSFGVYLNPGI